MVAASSVIFPSPPWVVRLVFFIFIHSFIHSSAGAAGAVIFT
jgi:hypothetical protein